jgi:hypothetical protein
MPIVQALPVDRLFMLVYNFLTSSHVPLDVRHFRSYLMTILLEKAFQETISLPAEKQDQIAHLLLEALDTLEWDRQFADSQDVLALLAEEGLADWEAGRTKRLSA